MAKKKLVKHPALLTWVALNDFLMESDEATCQQLLRIEMRGRARQQFMKRIHSRINKLRAERERQELEAKANG